MTDVINFLHVLAEKKISNNETAVALLWLHSLSDLSATRSPKELAADMESAGYAKQNTSRLTKALEKDRRTAKAAEGHFRVSIKAKTVLDSEYSVFIGNRPIKITSSVLPADMFEGTRGYIENVVAQVNASFDGGLYDCCTVMCRRLVETLLIETYEALGKAGELKNDQGQFMMLSGMLSAVEANNSAGLTRNALKGLKDFKILGDLSAHNRRFNARRDDIERVRGGLRVASEELLKISRLIR